MQNTGQYEHRAQLFSLSVLAENSVSSDVVNSISSATFHYNQSLKKWKYASLILINTEANHLLIILQYYKWL